MLAKALARTWKPILTILLAVFFAAPGGGPPPDLAIVDAWGNPVAEVAVSSQLYVRVSDSAANPSYSFDTVTVSVASIVGDSETLICYEQADGSFLGELSFSLAMSGWPGDGQLQILAGQAATATYLPVGGGDPLVVQATVVETSLLLVDENGAPTSSVVDGDRLRVRLEGPVGIDSLAPDTLSVVATRSGNSDSETFDIVETGPNSGVFLGSLPLARSGQDGTGVLDWSSAPATVTVTYTGPSSTVAATADVAGARVEVIGPHGDATDRLGPQDGLRLRVFDPFNDNPSSLIEYRGVSVTVSPGGDTENLWVWEVAPGVFESRTTFPFGAGGSGNGLLAVVPGSSQLLATYTPSVGAPVTANATVLDATLRFLNENGEEVADYLIGEWIELELRYPAGNVSGDLDQVQISLSSLIVADVETLQLFETGSSSGVFRGRLRSYYSSTPTNANQLDVYRYQVGPTAWNFDTVTASFDLGGGSLLTQNAPIRGGIEIELLSTTGEPRQTFGVGEDMLVRLVNHIYAEPGPSLETKTVFVQCLGSEYEWVQLTETGGNTSIFEAIVPIRAGSPYESGLQCLSGSEVEVSIGFDMAIQVEDRARIDEVAVHFVDAAGAPVSEILKGTTARVRVRSAAANADSHDFDTLSVTVASRNTLDSAVLELREITLDSGIFEGEVRIVGVGLGNYEDVEVGNGPPPLSLADVLVASVPGAEAEAAVLEGRLRVTDLAGNELSYLLHKGTVRVELEMPAIGYPGMQTTEMRIFTASEDEILTVWETSPVSNVFHKNLQLDPSLTYPYNSYDSTISPYVGSSVEFAHLASNLRLLLPVTSVDVHFEDTSGARLESAPYGVPLWVEVTKATNLLNPSQVESLQVAVSTDRLGDEELLTLTETTASSGIFRASLPVNASTGRIPGNLAVDADAGAVDTIRARVVGVEGVATSIPTRQAQVRFLNAQGQETDVLVLGQMATIEIVDPLRAFQTSISVEMESNEYPIFYGYAVPTYPGSATFRISFLPYNSSGGASPGSFLQPVALFPGQVVKVTLDYLYSYGASTGARATAEDRRLELLGEDGQELLELLEGESLKIRLTSSSQQNGVFESRTVTVGSQLSGDIETLELWETSASSGVFERVLSTRFYNYYDTTNQPNNGVLGLATENPSVPHTGERIVVRYDSMYESPIEKTVPAIVPGRLEVLNGNTPAVAVLPDYQTRTLRLVRPTLPNGSVVTFEVQSGYYVTDFETFNATSLGNGVFEAQIPCYPIGPGGSYSGNGYVEMAPGSEIFFRYQLTGYHTGQLERVLPVASATMSFVDVTTGEVLAEAPDARPFKLRIQDKQNLTGGIDYRTVTLTTQLGDSETYSVPEINTWQGIFELVVTPRVRDVATPNNVQLEVGRTSVLVVAPIYDRVTATMASPAIVASLPLTGPELAFTNAQGEVVSSIVTGALAYLRVDDNSVNFDPNLAETIQVAAYTFQDPYQTTTLVETGPATGIFTGSIPVVQGASVYNNGQIETYGGEMVRLTHTAFYYFQISTEVMVRASRLTFIAAPGGEPVEKYLEGESVYVRMEYAAGNTSPTVAEQISVELRSLYWGDDVESLVLTETAPSSGIFEGGMTTSLDPSISGDGTLQLGRGSSLDTALVSFGDDSATAEFEAARLRLLNLMLQPITELVPGQKLVVEVSKFAGTDAGQVDTLVGQTELVGLGGYDRESVTLVETGVDTHVFRGTMTTDTFGYYSWDGTLTFWYSEQVQVTFTDGPVSVVATVNGFYNQAPVVEADHITLTLGSSGNLDVLSDDFDPEGGALTLVALRPGPTSPDVSGVIEPNGTVTVTIPPDANLYGINYQEMIYTVVDPDGLFTEGYIFVTGLAPPTVTITSPADGSVFAAGPGSEIHFEALVTDPDQPDICSGMIAAAVWESDIQPIAFNGCALNLPVSYFQVGTHVFTVTVTDFNNNVVTDTVTITIDGPPVLTMTSPAPGTTLQGGGITLAASAIDAEDGDLGASILWLSNVQGELGTGASLPVVLTPGSHNISARVMDSAGNDVRLDRWVEVNAQPVITIDSPIEGARMVGVPEVIASVTASDIELGQLTYEWWIDGTLQATSTATTQAFIDLAPGAHSLMVKAIDNLDGEGTDTVNFTVIEAPVVSINAPTPYSVFVLGQSILFTATATDFEDGNLAAQIVWTSNIDGPIGTGGSFSISTLSRNSHTITATVEDADGLVDTATLILEVQTAPTVTINYPGEGESFPEGAQVSLGGAASDFEEGDISNEIVWTSSRDGALGTGAAFSVFNLTAGQHVITATITDNLGAIATDTVTILINTPPTVSITAPATGSTVNQGVVVSFTGTATDAQDGNLTASISWSSNLDGALGTGAAVNTSSLSVGTHVITASVTDSHGAPDTDTITITINAPPSVAITAPAAGSSFVEGVNVSFTGTASDPEDGNLAASISWSSNLDGALGTGASVNSGSLSVGTHVITASVTDANGVVASATLSITITANTAPTVTITAPATGSTVNQGVVVSFTGTATDAQDGNLTASISWSSDLDGALGTGAAVNTSSLSVGTHVITASVTDSHGAPDTDTITITINAPPSVAITAPAAGASFVEGTNVTFTGTASDPEDGNLAASISWSSNLDGAVGTGASANSGTLSVGTHVITASVTDANGSTASATRSITITANTAPTVTITAPATGGTVNQGASVSFTGTASDTEDGSLSASISWSSSLDGALGTGAAVNSSSLSVGTHVITASVTDSNGAPDTDTITITINAPPSVAITAPAAGASFVEGVNVSFTGTASDPEDGNLAASISWSSNLDGALGTGASVNSSSLSVGTHVITASVTDASGSTATATRSITITANTAPAVSITAPASGGTVNQGASVSFTGTATDTQDGNLTASISWSSNLDGALGTGASVNSSSLSVGTHVITASVTDSHGAPDTDTITITINALPSVSILAPAGGSSYIQGAVVSFQASATDPEDGNLNPGLTWTSNLDGVIGSGGAPSTSVLSVGNHLITASVVDSNGAPASAAVSITILGNTAPAVTISSPTSSVWVAVGDSVTFTGSALDAQSGDLSAALVWTSTIAGNIGIGASFSTAALSVGSHTITAAVTDPQGLVGSAVITVEVKVVSTATFISVGAQDGFVLESGENTNVGGTVSTASPRLGDNNADRQYRSFLSFDTSSLPDNAVIRNVTVRAQRSGTTGTNPATTHGTLQVDVKTGFFGTTVSLQSADFQDAATVSDACSMTPAAANGQWSVGTLNAAGRSAVNLTGGTQLRLRFSLDDDDDVKNDFLDHYGGESTVASTRPQLVIEYLQ